MGMMRVGYERIGDRQFDVNALIPIGEGFVVIDHVGVSLFESGVHEVHFGVEGDVPLGRLEMNVPALGKLVGEVAPAVGVHPGEERALVYMAHRAPKPPQPTEEEIERALGVNEPSDNYG
ncbi:MAG TPA: hypothetical protein VN380_17990 [Thermoanaerobaculia bacterium]|jgi:hypothetical protein|nr:hypothetical protein [Thermoanaerobaculia bacterium]